MAAAPPRQRRRSWSVITGILLTVLGVLALIAGFVLAMLGAFGWVSESSARSNAIVEVAVPGASTIELDDGSYVAFALGDGLVTSRFDQVRNLSEAVRGDFADPVVNLIGPDGASLTASTPRVETLEDRPGTDLASVSQFRVTAPGDYRIEVVSGSPAGGGPVSSVILRESHGLSALGASEGLAVGVILLMVGGVALTLGVVLLVTGLVRRSLGSTIR